MVSHVPRDGGTVLDVATGTGLVAERLLARGHRVTGLDQSPDMLAVARSRFGDRVDLVEASATELPFADASFDHLTFTYLLRYVDDPAATLAELARVVRPGGTIANLEFCVPRGIWRPLWDLYVGVGLPALGRIARRAGTTSAASSARRFAGSTSGGRSSDSSSSGAKQVSATCRPGA